MITMTCNNEEEKRMLNLNKCYMDKLCKCGEFKADEFVNDRDVDNRKMNVDEKYQDPGDFA